MSGDSSLEKAKKYFYAEYQFSQSAYGILSDLMAALTGYFGFSVSASNLLISSSSYTIPLQLLGTAKYIRTKNRGRFLRLAVCGWRLLLPLVFLCALLPQHIGRIGMACAYVVMVACYQFAVSPYTEWAISTIGEHIRENFYMIRSTVWLITYTVFSLLVGVYIDHMRDIDQMQTGILTVGGFLAVLLLASVVFFLCCPADTGLRRQKVSVPLRQIFCTAVTNRPFLRVMAIHMVMSFSSAFFNGFATLYRIQILSISLFDITLWSTVGYALRVLISPLITKAASHIGWARITGLVFLVMGVVSACFTAVDADSRILLPVLSVLIVMPHTTYEVGFLKMEISVTPEENRSVYFTLKSLAGCVVSILTSLFSTALIGILETYNPDLLRYLFLIGAFGMGICAALCYTVYQKLKI